MEDSSLVPTDYNKSHAQTDHNRIGLPSFQTTARKSSSCVLGLQVQVLADQSDDTAQWQEAVKQVSSQEEWSKFSLIAYLL